MPSPEASRGNLEKARAQGRVKRLRSDRESRIIKLLIWQWFFDQEPKPSGRALARQLGVWPSYVCKVQKQATRAGWDALARYGRRVTVADLDEARRFTAKLREQEPGLLAPEQQARAPSEPPWMTADESIAQTRRSAEEWKRKHVRYSRRGWSCW